jgi:hypothetical protein
MTTETSLIEVRVLDMRPHPDQATNNPGCWAVQYEVSYDGQRRTFWRWHTVRTFKHGQYVKTTSTDKPKAKDVIKRFWADTFAELHGFSFNKDDP